MEKLYYSIGEVAVILGENTSLVRFWANKFPKFIKPGRNGKGNRMFTAADVECLKNIHFLVKVKGMTLDGAARHMAAGSGDMAMKVKVLEKLKAVREQLEEVRRSL